MKDFSFIIVTYNSEEVIEKCLKSIGGLVYDKDKIEMFVVDNNSNDRTKKIIRENFNEVKLIELNNNFGYAYACNMGIEKSTGKFVILLNPDVIFYKDFLMNVYNFVSSSSYLGGIVPRMTDLNGTLLTYPKIPTVLNRIYKYSGLYGILHHDEVLYHNLNEVEAPISIKNLEGPVAIFPSPVFKKVGLLDSSFFLTHELSEFSLRIQRKGLKLIYLPSAKIVHLISESSGDSRKDLSSVVHRAEITFFEVAYGRSKAIHVKFLILGILVLRIIFQIFAFRKDLQRTKKLLKIFLNISG